MNTHSSHACSLHPMPHPSGFDQYSQMFRAVSAALLLTALAGCGTAQYDEKYHATLKSLQHETPFRGLWEEPVKDFPRGQLSLRLPKFFRTGAIPEGNAATGEASAFDPPPALSPDPKRPEDVVDPYRVMPKFLPLPGHLRTYEGFTKVQSRLTADSLTKPFYLYIGMISSTRSNDKPLSGEELQKILHDRLAKYVENDVHLKGTKLEVGKWEDVEPKPKTADGGEMTWKRLKATGDQFWVSYEDKVARKKVYPGGYWLYLHSTPDYHVLLAWRCSQAVADTIGLEKAAGPCAGSVKVGN